MRSGLRVGLVLILREDCGVPAGSRLVPLVLAAGRLTMVGGAIDNLLVCAEAWDDRSASAHPGDERDIANWAFGLVELTAIVLSHAAAPLRGCVLGGVKPRAAMGRKRQVGRALRERSPMKAGRCQDE